MVYSGSILSAVSCILLVVFCVTRKTSYRKIEEKYRKEMAAQENYLSIYHSKLIASSPYSFTKSSPFKSIEGNGKLTGRGSPSKKRSLDHRRYYKQQMMATSISADCLKANENYTSGDNKKQCFHDDRMYRGYELDKRTRYGQTDCSSLCVHSCSVTSETDQSEFWQAAPGDGLGGQLRPPALSKPKP